MKQFHRKLTFWGHISQLSHAYAKTTNQEISDRHGTALLLGVAQEVPNLHPLAVLLFIQPLLRSKEAPEISG